jgi:glyoxylase-like metal-dependent hydrolase (beta-lactamase superfamily II)
MAVHSPFATTMWDYIHRAMPLGQEGTLNPGEVYSLTAFLLYSNGVIKEDEVMNAQSLPAIQMPNRDGYALAPPWEHGKPRLVDYPIASLSAPAIVAQGQGPERAAAPFITHQLKPNVYWIEGGGGNSGVIIGDKGVIIIDAKTTAAGGKELLEAIAKITPKPVTTVILTHSDADHVNGLASFPAGVKVIAHENNKKEQEAALAAGGRGAPPADHLPSQVISKNKQNLKIEGVKLELYHWAPAHTSGDLVIYLPTEKIVFTGDIIAGGKAADPLIHLEKNGSSEGWITTVKGIAAINADQFVEGHGDVLAKADIQKRLADAEAKRAKIKDLVAQGKSLDEIRTAVGDPPPVQGGGGRGPGFPSFTQVVYQELTKKAA